jgi:sulfite reductase (NADPH) flavoprotein alpha-component
MRSGIPPGRFLECGFASWVCFRSYTHFCRCGKLLDAAFEAAGSQRLVDRVDVNKEDWPVIDSWLSAVVAAITNLPLQSFADLGLGK